MGFGDGVAVEVIQGNSLQQQLVGPHECDAGLGLAGRRGTGLGTRLRDRLAPSVGVRLMAALRGGSAQPTLHLPTLTML